MNIQIREAIESHYECRLTGDLIRLTGGYENDAWRVNSDRGVLVVRMTPIWRTSDELRWVHRLTRHCAEHIPQVVAPLLTGDNDTLIAVNQRFISVFPFVEGQLLDRENAVQRQHAAQLLGAIHRVTQSWQEPRPASQVTLPHNLSDEHDLPELADPDLDRWHESLMQFDVTMRGVIHGDFYRANIICQGDKVVGIIDWDESRMAPLIEESAWSAWEFTRNPAGDDLLDDQARDFMTAYATAGGLLSESDWQHIIPAIRWRLRNEVRSALAAEARDDDVDKDYRDAEIRAFLRLKIGNFLLYN